jgi:hypothetical protein
MTLPMTELQAFVTLGGISAGLPTGSTSRNRR